MRFARSTSSQRASESRHTGSSSRGQTPATAAQTSTLPSSSRARVNRTSTAASSVRSAPIADTAELGGELLGPLAARVVVDRDARALGRERAHARRADAAGAAGDEHALAREARVHRAEVNLPPMRVHVISDIEGVAGIVKWGQAGGDLPLYQEARRLYTEEINAAVRGAKAAGATEIVVMDCHGAGGDYTFNSLAARPARSRTASSSCSRSGPSTPSSSSRAATPRSSSACTRWRARRTACSRTPSRGRRGRALRFNGTLVGETGINAALCGQWGCPVLLVTGDRAVCREATALLGDGLTTVEVKQGLGRFSARSLTATRARELIEEGAKQALRDLSAVQPYDPGRPCEIQVDFTTPDRLEEYRHRRGVEVTGPVSIVSRGDDWWQAWSNFYF